ncbi:MAG: DUF308 domain-containing protein [Saccharofermentans sp.]|nr:DUF308 domain-containing protein [Saccharofermentans sp.]
MNSRSVVSIRIAKYGYIVMSALFCIAGILMLIKPDLSVNAIGLFAGLSMIGFGAIKLIGYFSKDLFRLAFQYDLQFGALLVILGIITLFNPGDIMSFVCVTGGICIIAGCLFKVGISLEAKTFGIDEWWITTVLAAFAGTVGIMLVLRPSEVMKTMVIILGIAMLADGLLNICVALSMVKIVKNQKPELAE